MASIRLSCHTQTMIAKSIAKSMIKKLFDEDAAKRLVNEYLQAGYQHFYGNYELHDAWQLLHARGLVDRLSSINVSDIVNVNGSWRDLSRETSHKAMGEMLQVKPFELRSWRDYCFAQITVYFDAESFKYPDDLPERMAISEECEPFARAFIEAYTPLITAVTAELETLSTVASIISKSTTDVALITALPEIEDVVKTCVGIAEPLSLPAVANQAQVSSFLTSLKPIDSPVVA